MEQGTDYNIDRKTGKAILTPAGRKKWIEINNREKEKYKPKEKRDYFIKVPQKWWRKTLGGLSAHERCVMVSLTVWGALQPSTRALSRELNMGRRTVKKVLKQLEKKGYLKPNGTMC